MNSREWLNQHTLEKILYKKRFSLFPTKLSSGQWLWLKRFYHRSSVVEYNNHGFNFILRTSSDKLTTEETLARKLAE